MRKGNPFVDIDPLSKLNLKETTEFVKAFPVGVKKDNKRNVVEAPPTPGRPVFSFSVGNNVTRKNPVSSKWNDAEKWLISDQNQNHHLDGFVKSADFVSRKSTSSNGIKQNQSKVISEEKVSIFKDNHHYHNSKPSSDSFDVLKGKLLNYPFPTFLAFSLYLIYGLSCFLFLISSRYLM